MMGKWMIVVNHPLDELKHFGGFLTKLKIDLHKLDINLAVHDKPYVVYLSAADTENKGQHISVSQMKRYVYETSQFLNFNYNIFFDGRNYYNNIELIPEQELKRKLRNDIRLVRPEFIFLHSQLYFLLDFIKKEFPNITCLINSERHGAYVNILKRDAFEFNDVDQLYKAYTLYKELVSPFPAHNSWEYKYYTMALAGSDIYTDFAETYNLEHSTHSFIYNLTGLEVDFNAATNTNVNEAKELTIEEIL
jgi:hypothetical protein